ncbi:hypothetical protein, partial [Burkholderia cenocepacia]|uniref:hypothetical protein n=1 Tax=Burkholderia cenocepacia TaxID=95486 RepID=UPI001C8A4F9E
MNSLVFSLMVTRAAWRRARILIQRDAGDSSGRPGRQARKTRTASGSVRTHAGESQAAGTRYQTAQHEHPNAPQKPFASDVGNVRPHAP